MIAIAIRKRFAVLRRSGILLSVLLISGCSSLERQPADAGSDNDAAVVSALSIDPRFRGEWFPYSTDASRFFGKLSIEEQMLHFSGGVTFQLKNQGTYLTVVSLDETKQGAKVQFCGDDGPKSFKLEESDAPKTGALAVSFYNVATGPGPDEDFDPHLCGTQYYVRE